MKKAGMHGLLSVTVIFTALVIGIFIGRRMGPVPLTAESPETGGSAAAVIQDGRIDLNTAALQDLQEVPGIGPVLAQRIITYREDNGPFESITDLANVEGIGLKRVDILDDYVTVGG